MVIASFHVGDRISVNVLRDSKEITFQIVVVERKEQQELAALKGKSEGFGMTVQEITPEIARHLGISQKIGVVVSQVQEGSPADDAGIQPMDIILQVNKVKIYSSNDYSREISKAKNGIMLLIKRGKATFFVPLRK